MSKGERMKGRLIEFGMENYYDAYKKNWPHKDTEDAIRATRNWVTGFIKGISGSLSIDQDITERIERELNELRFKDS